jgi:hypothetical protein
VRICLLANIAVLSAGVATAQGQGLPLTPVIGVVGIGSGQTPHLNVFNPGTGAPLLGVRSTHAHFCQRPGNRAEDRHGHNRSGKNSIADLTPEAFNGRVELYAVVLSPPIGQAPNVGYCTLVPAIEIIYNATGNTIAALTESRLRPPAPPTQVTPTTKTPD